MSPQFTVRYRVSGILALVLALALLLIGGGTALNAQVSMEEKEEDGGADIGMPGGGDSGETGLIFCDGDVCPGQTCDEVNDRCVGSLTLQPCLGEPLSGLTAAEQQRFFVGKDEFSRTFTEADGLGPVFNQDSCSSCHNMPVGGSGSQTVVRFGFNNGGVFDPLTDLGGSLLNQQSFSSACAENIPFPPANTFAFRLTNSTLGFGLVEAIPDADLEANEILPPGPVSGKAHIVPVLEEPGMTAVGRFGWKSQLATVLSFSADASLEEMGITNRIFPHDNAPNADEERLAACDTVADPETLPDASGVEFIDRVTDFQRFLAPPPQVPRSGMSGEVVFNDIGCADCHISSFTADDTDDELEDAIAGKTFSPYSDFLLHDMGEAADQIPQGDAEAGELRTTPLWGLRIRDPLWHDGRFGGGLFQTRVNNAIAAHGANGSEAVASAQAYANLPNQNQRDALVSFLGSLGRCEFDMDGDNDVDEDDQLQFHNCLNNPVQDYGPDDPCAVADVDGDGDVDLDDQELFMVAKGDVVDLPDDEDDDEDGDENDDSASIADVIDQIGGDGQFTDLMGNQQRGQSNQTADTENPEAGTRSQQTRGRRSAATARGGSGR